MKHIDKTIIVKKAKNGVILSKNNKDLEVIERGEDFNSNLIQHLIGDILDKIQVPNALSYDKYKELKITITVEDNIPSPTSID